MEENWELLSARQLVAVVKDPKETEAVLPKENNIKSVYWTGSTSEQAEVGNGSK
jgi:hypothetical protein